jgi:hypothetical protein
VIEYALKVLVRIVGHTPAKGSGASRQQDPRK